MKKFDKKLAAAASLLLLFSFPLISSAEEDAGLLIIYETEEQTESGAKEEANLSEIAEAYKEVLIKIADKEEGYDFSWDITEYDEEQGHSYFLHDMDEDDTAELIVATDRLRNGSPEHSWHVYKYDKSSGTVNRLILGYDKYGEELGFTDVEIPNEGPGLRSSIYVPDGWMYVDDITIAGDQLTYEVIIEEPYDEEKWSAYKASVHEPEWTDIADFTALEELE